MRQEAGGWSAVLQRVWSQPDAGCRYFRRKKSAADSKTSVPGASVPKQKVSVPRESEPEQKVSAPRASVPEQRTSASGMSAQEMRRETSSGFAGS